MTISELLYSIGQRYCGDSEVVELCRLVGEMLRKAERPTLAQAVAAAGEIGISELEAANYWHTREASDWLKSTAGGGTTPVGKNWRSDAKVFTNSMRERQSRSQNGSANGFHAQPKAETVWSLKQALDAVNDQIQEIENYRSPGAWGDLPTSKRIEKTKLIERRSELKRKLAGLAE